MTDDQKQAIVSMFIDMGRGVVVSDARIAATIPDDVQAQAKAKQTRAACNYWAFLPLSMAAADEGLCQLTVNGERVFSGMLPRDGC